MYQQQKPQFQRGKNRKMANKGKHLEDLVRLISRQYAHKGIADIQKIPTPIGVGKTKEDKTIENARFEKGYLVDYIGILNDGRATIFDAKECEQNTFPLSYVKQHQYDILRRWHNLGAISFLFVHMKKVDKFYHVPFPVLQTAWENRQSGVYGTASIPQKVFDEQCIEAKFNETNGVMRDFLTSFY